MGKSIYAAPAHSWVLISVRTLNFLLGHPYLTQTSRKPSAVWLDPLMTPANIETLQWDCSVSFPNSLRLGELDPGTIRKQLFSFFYVFSPVGDHTDTYCFLGSLATFYDIIVSQNGSPSPITFQYYFHLQRWKLRCLPALESGRGEGPPV